MTPNGLIEFHLAQWELRGVIWSHLKWSLSHFSFFCWSRVLNGVIVILVESFKRSWSHMSGVIVI